MGTSQKFDVIHFANHPDEWTAFKENNQLEIKLNRIAEFLEPHIKENFANFNPSDIHSEGLFMQGGLKTYENLRWQFIFKYELSMLKRNISKVFIFDSNKNSKMYNGIVDNDFVNFEGKNEQKYKDDFVELYSFIHYYLGGSKMLISETDIMVKILGKGKSNYGFKNIKHLNLFKSTFNNYIKEHEKAVRFMNEKLVLHDENENIKKQRGTYNQYFPEWDAETISMKQGDKIVFYKNVFSIKYPDLKRYPYYKFSANFRKSKSNDLKALRGKK